MGPDSGKWASSSSLSSSRYDACYPGTPKVLGASPTSFCVLFKLFVVARAETLPTQSE